MRIPRLRCTALAEPGTRLALDAEASHRILRVLRLAPGAEVVLFDGSGIEARARLASLDPAGVDLEILERRPGLPPSPLRVTLVQGLARGERMDYSIQKAVELGVAAIQPLLTRYSQVRLRGERLERRLAHWRGIVVGACEQCGRSDIPPVHPLLPFDAWLEQTGTPGYYLDPAGRVPLAEAGDPPQSIDLLIGPEGGLATEERERLQAAGWTGLRLGPRILRTETAGIAALAGMQLLWGDLGG